MKLTIFTLLKIITGISLTAFFVLNSWIIFLNYLEGATVTSSSVVLNKQKLKLPAIIICRENAYNIKKYMGKLDEFLENTAKLKYDIEDPGGDYLDSNSTQLEKTSIFSVNRGHCHVVKYNVEASI